MEQQSTDILDDFISKFLSQANSTNLVDPIESKFARLKPGYYVVFNKDNVIYYGIVLSNYRIIYFTSKGQLMGYCSTKCDIKKIYKPGTYYALTDLDQMELVWEAPKKVTKSISEIEKALGLEPGTFEIK